MKGKIPPKKGKVRNRSMLRALRRTSPSPHHDGPPDIHGNRRYVIGVSVNTVKKKLGKLARKVRAAGDGRVEIIETSNKLGPVRRKHGSISTASRINDALQELATDHAIKTGKVIKTNPYS